MKPTHLRVLILTLALLGVILPGSSAPIEMTPLPAQDFKNLKAAPANHPHQNAPLGTSASATMSPVPPKAHALSLRVLKDGRFFKGSFAIKGTIVSASANMVTFLPLQGPPAYTIGFALPGVLKLKKELNVSGSLDVIEHSSMLGADQQVIIRDNVGVHAAYIWQFRKGPIFFSLPDSVGAMRQDSTGFSVSIVTRGNTIPLVPGKTTNFKSGSRWYSAFVQTSIFQKQSFKREVDGAGTGYVLRAIVLAR